jgi:hypothetical protein
LIKQQHHTVMEEAIANVSYYNNLYVCILFTKWNHRLCEYLCHLFYRYETLVGEHDRLNSREMSEGNVRV